MNTIKNNQAVDFYNDLIAQNIVEKNQVIKDRISEVLHWQQAFITIIKYSNYFKVNIKEKEKLIQLVKQYNFRKEFIISLEIN